MGQGQPHSEGGARLGLNPIPATTAVGPAEVWIPSEPQLLICDTGVMAVPPSQWAVKAHHCGCSPSPERGLSRQHGAPQAPTAPRVWAEPAALACDSPAGRLRGGERASPNTCFDPRAHAQAAQEVMQTGLAGKPRGPGPWDPRA